MLKLILLYAGGVLTAIWGIAHLFPTNSVVKGFGKLSADNRNIITMEWIVEGVFLIFLGVLVASVTFLDARGIVATVVYLLTVIALMGLAMVSLFTGFNVKFLPFKLCPFIFTAAALLIFVGRFL
jgi:hypothetical protein